MPNDDLGQFPTPPVTPPATSPNVIDPTSVKPDESTLLDDINAPAPTDISTEPFSVPPSIVSTDSTPTMSPMTDTPVTPSVELDTPVSLEAHPAFEETPDEIPSAPVVSPVTESMTPVVETPSVMVPQPEIIPQPETQSVTPVVETTTTSSLPTPEPDPLLKNVWDHSTSTTTPIASLTTPEPVAATVPTPKGGSSFGSLIAIVLLLISGVALAITVFLFSQSQQLKKQLGEVTQTLEQQRTTITPTPTPTIIDFPTPSITPVITPEATISATPTPTSIITITPTPSPTATVSGYLGVMPLADASKALQVAINHLPNAQMIIIKTENATTPTAATTKYFFRQDLTTKRYFYVLITDSNEPEIVDKAIYVTPDNNIPSLNDTVQSNKLGIDLDLALKISNDACTSNQCATATVKAQYIKSNENLIWQLTFDPVDATKNPQTIQINATTREILYKTAGF
jgi:hypothetical protein